MDNHLDVPLASVEPLLEVKLDLLNGRLLNLGALESSQTTYPPGTEPSRQQTYHWLLWLAHQLRQDETSEFFIERMQPHWLGTQFQRALYRAGVGLITGLIIALIYGVSTGLIGASIGGITYGLILAFTQEIYPIESLKWDFNSARVRLWESLLEGLWWGLVYGVIDALIGWLLWGVSGLIWGMIEVVIWGLVEGLIWGLSVPEFRSSSRSNQGIWDSAKNAGIFTIIGGLAWFFLYVGVLWSVHEPLEFPDLLVDGLGCGLFFGLYVGGLACIQHFMLRLILWWNGDIPWNYAKFLDYATELGLLERSAGGYRFIQDLKSIEVLLQ